MNELVEVGDARIAGLLHELAPKSEVHEVAPLPIGVGHDLVLEQERLDVRIGVRVNQVERLLLEVGRPL